MHRTFFEKVMYEIWDLIKFFVPIVIIVIIVRTQIAQPFIVDGESSAPNFHSGHYLIVDELSYRFHEPARGDVIVMRYPLQPSRFFLKRIIGLPGERIVIRDGRVWIYNSEHPDGFILSEPYQKQATYSMNEKFDDVTLEADQYYVMGDNRSGSDDSRSWGTLPRKNITGRAFLRLYPFSLIGITPASPDDFIPGSTS